MQIIETGASPAQVPGAADSSSSAARANAKGAIRRDALLERFGGNQKLLKTLIKTFRHDCPKMMAKIRSALSTRNPRAVADAAHGLKGSVGNFGTSAAFETVREMEKTARQGKLDGAWELYATLEDEIALLLPALHAIGAQKRPLRRTGRSHHAPGRKR